MKRKLILILFFTVVFGFPISWYLILQVFGENQFALPVIRNVEEGCISVYDRQAYLILDSSKIANNPNLNKRITKKLEVIELDLSVNYHFKKQCDSDKEMIFVDSVGQVLGEYELSREEVDRLFAELDIYTLNVKRNER
ncbi:MAG: hypothetical protein RIA69_03940 [Cyclobacteriaceae bacterium]